VSGYEEELLPKDKNLLFCFPGMSETAVLPFVCFEKYWKACCNVRTVDDPFSDLDTKRNGRLGYFAMAAGGLPRTM